MAGLLIVEDDPMEQELYTLQLERLGHEFRFTAGGAPALECLRAEPFDCLLLDDILHLDENTAFIRTIRESREPFAAIPIIAVGGLALAEERRAILGAGANEYILKPYPMCRALAAALRQLGISSPGFPGNGHAPAANNGQERHSAIEASARSFTQMHCTRFA